jgi:hypothetical protein
MANIKLYFRNGFYCLDNGSKVHYLDPSQLGLEDLQNGRVRISYDPLSEPNRNSSHTYAEVQDEDGIAYGTTMQDVLEGVSRHSDVKINDQTTPMLAVPFNQPLTLTTLTAQPSIGDRIVNVTSSAGMSVGHMLTIFNRDAVRFTNFLIVAINSNAITLDSPVDFAYPVSGTVVNSGNIDMAVDGSATPVVFGLRGEAPASTALPVAFDVTRIIFAMETDTAVDLSKFGDLTALTNGILLRKRDGIYQNILNVKSNLGIAAAMYDWTPHAATNPIQGQDGFVSRWTFGGQSKMGVVARLEAGEDLQYLVQDDLRLIGRFSIMAEGHIVDKS